MVEKKAVLSVGVYCLILLDLLALLLQPIRVPLLLCQVLELLRLGVDCSPRFSLFLQPLQGTETNIPPVASDNQDNISERIEQQQTAEILGQLGVLQHLERSYRETVLWARSKSPIIGRKILKERRFHTEMEETLIYG